MKDALRFLGFIWALPGFVLSWLLYVGPLWAFGRITYSGYVSFLVWRFEVNTALAPKSWWVRKWEGWRGFAGHSFIIMKTQSPVVLTHELRHTDQAFLLGVFYFPAHGFFRLVTGYRANPLEKDARDHEHDSPT